jgi:hypothetical protein
MALLSGLLSCEPVNPRKLMSHCSKRLSILAAIVGLSAVGCSSKQSASLHQPIQAKNPTFAEVVKITTEHEHAIDDGWWFEQYPRIFKSGYAAATPQLKAQFACDYAKMLADSKQDLVAHWDSYVTYTKRSNFADKWWHDHDNSGRYAALNRKMHIVWIHEALLDGGELWWRAFEIKNADNFPGATALAHDEEQKKVFNYLDVEGHPRSLSDFVASGASTK